MSWIIKLWTWFNGKKTNIGAGLLLLAAIILQLSKIWCMGFWWLMPLTDTLNYIGGLLTGAGLAHKAVKGIEAKNA